MASRINNTYAQTQSVINIPGGGNTMVQYNKNGTFAGDNGFKYNESLKELSVQGNINVGGWVKGKIYTNKYNFFLTGGNAGQVLTTDGTGNLSWTDQTGGGGGSGNYSNSNVSAYLSTFTGNISAGNIKTNNLLYANGVAWNFAGTYSNSNVANYLPTYTGNVGAGNVKTDNLLYANGVAWNFAGTYSNANVANYLPAYVGNISASFFAGNGSQLTGITTSRISNGNSNVNVTSTNGNIVVTANSGASKSWNFGTTGSLTFPDGATTTGANITAATTGNLKLTTSSLTSVTAPCYIGLSTEYVADTEFNNDITVVQVGWTVVVNSVTYTVTYIDPAPPANQYRITVDGAAGFVSGTSYTFTNPVPVEVTWTFGSTGVLSKSDATGLVLAANYSAQIITDFGDNNRTWTFDGSSGELVLPGGTVLIDPTDDNFEVRGAQSINFEANAVVNIYTDTSTNGWQWQFGADGTLTSPNSVVQNASGSVTCNAGAPTVIYTGSSTGKTTLKLLIQVEGAEVLGQQWDTQSCEMVVARGLRNNTVVGSVYGLAYTSTNPLATFNAIWNNATSRVEITCTPVSSTLGVEARVSVIEMITSA